MTDLGALLDAYRDAVQFQSAVMNCNCDKCPAKRLEDAARELAAREAIVRAFANEAERVAAI